MEGYSYTTIEMEYEPIAAYSTDGPTQYASGGSYSVGVTIHWTMERGITNYGWYETDVNSPFHFDVPMTTEEVNACFNQWNASANSDQRKAFISTIWSCCDI